MLAPIRMAVAGLILLIGCGPAPKPPAAAAADPETAIKARGDSLELPGQWTAPPGDRLAHSIAGFAKTLCSAVFITGLEPADAAESVGYFTGPYEDRKQVKDTVIDRKTSSVRLTTISGITRVARKYGSQGCIALPIGQDSVSFTPSIVASKLPPAATTPWPMGDIVAEAPWPAGIDSARFATALDTLFGTAGAMTLGVVVTYQGRIIGERYAPGIGAHTPLESWSMGKSLTGTLMATLIMDGTYQLTQPAPIPEWQTAGDPRQEIRITDLMRMSSGLRIRAPNDPGFVDSAGYPDHLYLYTGTVNSFQYAATRPQQWKPNTVGRYRNTDPVLANYLIRLAVEKRGENYHAFPRRVLFDKIGIRDAVMETDPYGNFLTQGYEFLSARDWARLGNLYLQDGVSGGDRLLPEGYVDYVRTPAPAWVADDNPVYGGGFFWVNADGSYAMLGAGGQSTTIIPSRQLVVVRLGKFKGAREGDRATARGVALLTATIPSP